MCEGACPGPGPDPATGGSGGGLGLPGNGSRVYTQPIPPPLSAPSPASSPPPLAAPSLSPPPTLTPPHCPWPPRPWDWLPGAGGGAWCGGGLFADRQSHQRQVKVDGRTDGAGHAHGAGAAMTELHEVQITEEKPLLVPPTQPVPGKKHSVETPYGLVTFTVHGSPKPKRPAILTYHDVGLNHQSCFEPLFRFEDMQEIVKNFVVVHVDAPGMEEGAPLFPLGYQYPSLDQLADMIPCILQYLNFTSIIGIGVGAGAYILARYSLSHPDTVEGLVLINIDPNAKGWMDWAAHKLSGLTSSIPEMILAHLFSQEELSGCTELVQQYKEGLVGAPNLSNIQLYWSSYNSRRDLNFERGGDVTLKCPVMLVVGDQAPHEDAVVECNSKLDPTQTSFLKMADSGGQPQLMQPGKLTEAFKYFVQGMGYMASSCMTRLSRSRTASLSSAASGDGNRSRTLSQSSESGAPQPQPPLPPAPGGGAPTMEVSC